MNEREMPSAIEALRSRWRTAREQKLSRKRALIGRAGDMEAVRHDREYKIHRKEQHEASKLIRHLERRLNMERARHERGDS